MMFTKRGRRVPEEAAALAQARHPGVVELVDTAGDVLRTRMVDGRSLADMKVMPAPEVAGMAAAVATTLADLHDLGMVHGAIEASHVLLAADGRPLLCSLGRRGDRADDVAALGALVADLLAKAPPEHPGRSRLGPPGHRRRLGPMLAPPVTPALTALAERARAPEPADRPTARAFADAISQRIPSARLPGVTVLRTPERPTLPALERLGVEMAQRPASSAANAARAAKAASLLVGIVVAGAWALSRQGGSADVGPAAERRGEARARSGAHDCSPACASAGPSAPRQPKGPTRPMPVPATPHRPNAPATTAAVATRVWPVEPLDLRDGVLTYGGSRYVLAEPGDSLVAGDWGCTGEPSLALLRRDAGEIFAFDGWPHVQETLTARSLGRIEGARDLRVVDIDGDGCHELEVQRTAAPPVRVRVRA